MKKVLMICSILLTAHFTFAQPGTSPKAIPTNPTVDPAPPPTPPKPVIDINKVAVFKNDNYDFGKIPFGKPVEFEVEVKNISGDSLKIENVRVGCGCTTPKWQPGPYANNSTFKITLGFNGNADGSFEKYATIIFANGAEKQVKFHGVGFKTPENSAPTNEGTDKMKKGGQ